jgi:AcrR family transcriptional regulator
VTRWEPDASGRLQRAALDLFSQQGFSSVTVAQVAEAAGVTERTFFRHFPTKEDVIFRDGPAILSGLVHAIRTAPADDSAVDLLHAVGRELGRLFEHDRMHHRQRAKVIASEPALRERELLKHLEWSTAIADEIARRGVRRDRAAAIAGAATATFRVVYAAWAVDRNKTPLDRRLSDSLRQLAIDLEPGVRPTAS